MERNKKNQIMYDDSDEVQMLEMRQRMDRESGRTTEAVSELPSGEMGHSVEMGCEENDGPKGCVYFIETRDGAFVKIGYSTRVYGRIQEIGYRGDRTMRLLGWMPGTVATERWIHAKFASDRDHLEWFRNSASLKRFIGALGLILPEDKRSNVPEKDPGAVAMAKKRAASMTPERRSEIAAGAAEARWGPKKKTGKKA